MLHFVHKTWRTGTTPITLEACTDDFEVGIGQGMELIGTEEAAGTNQTEKPNTSNTRERHAMGRRLGQYW
jgi:hypothetical protein